MSGISLRRFIRRFLLLAAGIAGALLLLALASVGGGGRDWRSSGLPSWARETMAETQRLELRILRWTRGGRAPAPPVLAVPTPEEMAACSADEFPAKPPKYWRLGTFGDSPYSAGEWPSVALCAMGETSLTKPAKGRSRVRLLWLRSFDPAIAVRVEHASTGTRLFAMELDGQGGTPGGALAERLERELSPEEWSELQTRLSEAGFWNLPTMGPAPGCDGATWIVEVAEHHRYHVVERWIGQDIEGLGRYLLELSNLEPDPIY